MSGSIMLAATGGVFEDRLRAAFGDELRGELRRIDPRTDLNDPKAATATIAQELPSVVAVGSHIPVPQALAIAEALDVEHQITVVLVATRSPELLEEALRAGVRDVVHPDATEEEIRISFGRALETAARRRSSLGTDGGSTAPRSRVITVISPKGGSGKTTVATNLAVGLTGANAGGVALVDLDLQFGDVATAMRLMPEHSIADAARSGEYLDSMGLKLLLTPHPSGMFALCAPETPAEGEEVTAEAASRAVALLAQEFPFVVIDTSAGVTEHTLAAVEASTDLILLCTF